MVDENKNNPEPNANDDGGLGDLDPTAEGLLPEGSLSEAEIATMTDMGYDVDDVSPDAVETIKNVVQYLHSKREEDSQVLRSATEKAAEFDKIMANPMVRQALMGVPPQPQPLPGSQGKEDSVGARISPEKLTAAIQSDDPDALAGAINEGIQNAIAAGLQGFRADVVNPLEERANAMADIAAMDTAHPTWRDNITEVRTALSANPNLSLKDAYEQHVYIPNLKRENARLTRANGLNKRDKKKIVSIDGKSAKQTQTVSKPVEYESNRDAILAAIEASEAGN